MTQFDQLKKFFQENQFPILMFFVLSVLISIIFPTGFSIRYSYQLDDIAREPIIAPFDFGILKTEQKLNNDLERETDEELVKKIEDQSFVENDNNLHCIIPTPLCLWMLQATAHRLCLNIHKISLVLGII